MKRKTDKKRGLLYYFMRTFPVVLTFAFLTGFTFYYGLVKYGLRGMEIFSRQQIEQIEPLQEIFCDLFFDFPKGVFPIDLKNRGD